MSDPNVPPGTRALGHFDAAWREPRHGAQARAVRAAAERLRETFRAGPRCVSVRTLPLSTLPYPAKFAFQGAATTPLPFVTMTHRCLLVQFLQDGALKNLLFNPTDIEGARATPYFARLVLQFGQRVSSMLAKTFDPLEEQLARHGVAPGDVDYVAFDHFHTQDLRRLLGTAAAGPRFPNATLLAPRAEWDDWDDLHPMQRAWFVPGGKSGVRTDKVALTGGDLALGDGVMLVRTPGHTSGNQTLFVNTEDGVWGVSENGTSADNWSPLESRIRGIRGAARALDLDVVLNANTPEYAAEQYTSMVLEKTLVDRVRRAPVFVQMFPSSEVTPSLLAPGLTPALLHRAITSGEVVKKVARSVEAAA
ncbi:MAG: hypothetical protein JNL38_30955 [Myxococcales bacterium]|jgi:hypothetical protein|nr:hypothetical protein [Myxococcales bacterium]